MRCLLALCLLSLALPLPSPADGGDRRHVVTPRGWTTLAV